MFFVVHIERYIAVPPDSLGPNLFPFINSKLNQLLGMCTINHGYLITIFKIDSIANGIVNASGDGVFTVAFKGLVYRPFKGEVCDAIATGVERVGIELAIGCLKVLIPHTVPSTALA